jgi:hypothetical protein
MIKPEVLDALVAAGCTAEQIAAAVKADQSKSSGATRQARYRAAKKASRVTESDVTLRDGFPLKEIPPTPPKENNPLPASPIGSAAQAPVAAQPNQFDQLQAKLLSAAGIENFRAERAIGLVNLAPILGLIQQGYDLESDILPIVAVLFRRQKKPSSWAYCVQPIIEAATAKRGIPPKPKAAEIDWPAALLAFRNQGIWYAQRYGPPPGEPKCRVPPELLQDHAA